MKRTRSLDMTVGSPGRLIFLFSFPICASSLLRQAATVLVSMTVGSGCGVNALAAVGTSGTGYYPINWFLFGFSQGVCSVIGSSFGSGDRKQLREAVSTSVLLSLMVGGFLSVLGAASSGPMLRVLNTPDAIFGEAHLYLLLIAGGAVTELMYTFYSVTLCAMGNGRDPLIAIGILCGVMVSVTWVLIRFCGAGSWAAALAIITAQFAAALYCLFILRRMDVLKPEPGDRRFSPACFRRMLRMGLPLALELGTASIGSILMQRALNGYGSVTIAAYTAALSLDAIFQSVESAYGSVMTSYVSQNYGARKFGRIRRGLRSAFLIGLGISAVTTAVLLIAGRSLLGLYINPAEANAAEVLETGSRFLVVFAVCPFPLFLLHACRGSVVGLGKSAAALPGEVAEAVPRVVISFGFRSIFGWPSIFFAEVGAWICSGSVHLLMVLLSLRRCPSADLPDSGL